MPSELAKKTELLAAVAQSWNEAGIIYAVAHGADDFPTSIGRDLDVLVQPNQIDLALQLTEAVFRKRAWRVAYPRSIWGKRVVGVASDETRGMLEVHTLPYLSWRNVILARHPVPTAWIGAFKVDPWVSFAKRVVVPLLAHNVKRFAVPGEFSATDQELRAASEHLPHLIGARLAGLLIQAVRTADLEAAVRSIGKLRQSAMSRSVLLHPIGTLALAVHSVVRRLLQPFSPCAPIIALVGPDGVGKSTTLRGLEQRNGHVFLDVIVRHWRPNVLPQLARLAGKEVTRPDADGFLLPRRTPGRLQALRLLYYYLDFLIGGFIRDRIDSSRQRLVLYDRCFLDMAVDPVRFGLASARGTKVGWQLLPKPHRIILLTDEPARIHARKPELTIAELETHLGEWHRRAEAGEIDAVIRLPAAPDEIVRRIWDIIVDVYLEINGADPSGPRNDNYWTKPT